MSIKDHLLRQNVWFERFLHCPMPSASRFAQSLHVPGRGVAKGVLVRAGEAYALAVLPATARVDLARLSAVLGGGPVALASEEEVGRVFHDCERGAVPPFGTPYGVPTVFDTSLAGGAEVVCVGNARHEGFRLRYRDFEAVENPVRARFAAPIAPRQKRNNQRRAG